MRAGLAQKITLLCGEATPGTVRRRWAALEIVLKMGDARRCCALTDLAGSLVQTLSFVCVVNN